MKKFLRNLGVFTGFALLFYLIVLPLWSLIMPPFMAKNVRNCIGCYGHMNSRVKEIPKYGNVDILFTGSSHAYRGFDVRVFRKHGLNVFNLGSSSQTPIETYVLLQQYLDKLNPRLVILEVYAGTLGSDGVESSLDLAANNKIDLNFLETLPELRDLLTINSTLYGGFRQLTGLNVRFKEDSVQGDDHYITGGFVQTSYRENPMKAEKKQKWRVNPVQLKYLKKSLSLLKSKHIPFVLVQTPITSRLHEAKINNEEIDRALSALGSYHNFQGELQLDDATDFYDSNHMNQEAVRKFNELFIDYLRENGLFKIPR